MLKRLTVFSITFIISILCLFSSSACKDVTISDIGIPSSQSFEVGDIERCVWDMKLYNGKLYIGSGDYGKNTGPVAVWTYDLEKEVWGCSGTLPDEAITRFNIVNGKLIAPGVDPRQDWNVGNFYSLDGSDWKTNAVLPNAVHNFDVIEYKGKIVAGIGCDGKHYPALISHDNGLTFASMPFYKNGKIYDITQYSYSRTYELFVFNDILYALVFHKLFDESFVFELFRFENNGFSFVKNANNFLPVSPLSLNILNAKGQYEDKFFISTDYLYFTNDLSSFTKVELPDNEYASQFKIIDGTMYVLCFLPIIKEESFIFSVRMYQSDTGIDDFEELFCLEYDLPPICFDTDDGDTFFLGMGDKNIVHDKNGAVLMIET